MTTDDNICTAMFVCQKAMRPLALPHRKAILQALVSGKPLRVITKDGKLKRGERRPLYRGRKGLVASNSMSARVLETCRETVIGLMEGERERTFRGLTTWLMEDISSSVEYRADVEMEMF